MKKNLNVTAAVLDLRNVSEDTLASYEHIKLQLKRTGVIQFEDLVIKK